MNDAETHVGRPIAAPAGRGAAWLFEGFTLFQKNWAAWIGVTIILVVVTLAVSIIPLGSILFNLIVFAFMGGLMLGCREAYEGGDFDVGHLFAGFSENFGQYVLLGVIYSLGVLVIVILTLIPMIFMLGGMGFFADFQSGQVDKLLPYMATILVVVLIALLLYLPLIMAFWFAPALVALGNLTAVEAIKKSFAGCMVNVISYLVYGLVGLVLSLLATIPFLLGWLILCPMIVTSIYLSYRDIFESGPDS